MPDGPFKPWANCGQPSNPRKCRLGRDSPSNNPSRPSGFTPVCDSPSHLPAWNWAFQPPPSRRPPSEASQGRPIGPSRRPRRCGHVGRKGFSGRNYPHGFAYALSDKAGDNVSIVMFRFLHAADRTRRWEPRTLNPSGRGCAMPSNAICKRAFGQCRFPVPSHPVLPDDRYRPGATCARGSAVISGAKPAEIPRRPGQVSDGCAPGQEFWCDT